MKLPTFRQAIEGARATLRRFPVVLFDAALATVAALVLVDHEGPARPTLLFNILLAGILGIPLLTSLAIISERRKLKSLATLGLQMAGVLLLVAYASTIPADLTNAPLVTLFQFYILAIGLHLFLAVVPFVKKGEPNGFWQYNKTLFLRVLTGILYSLVLYAGLAIALAALDHLFGVSIPGKRYPELWIIINGLFTTWFILGGIPEDLGLLDALTDYPKTLRVFAQYILLPVVVVYFVILYAYLAKIAFVWDWPQGWVSKLILGFSGTGIFTLLLLQPVVDRSGNAFITRVARWFYILLVPLVVMLFLAVWRRVTEYGFTEGRYLAIALGIWISFLTFYFTLGKTKTSKVIPASLCLLAFLVSFGPWGTFSVARKSQIDRLGILSTEAGILVDGKIQQVHAELPFETTKQISAILAYLHEVHGFYGIQGWFQETLKEDSVTSGVAYKSPEAVARMMGVNYVSRWAEGPGGIVTLNAEGSFELSGYNRMAHMPMFPWDTGKIEVPADGFSYQTSEELSKITFVDLRTGSELLQIDLRRHAEELMKRFGTSASDRAPYSALALNDSGNGLRVRICPWQIQIQHSSGETKIIRLSGVILYTVEKPL